MSVNKKNVLNRVMRYRLVESNSDSITLKRRNVKQQVRWDSIKHLYPCARVRKGLKAPIDCILRDGSYFRICFLKNDTGNTLLQLYPYFVESLQKQQLQVKNTVFEYPIAWQKDKENSFRCGIILWTAALLFWLLFCTWILIKFPIFRTSLIYLQIAIPIVLFSSMMFFSYFRFQRRIYPTSIKIEDNRLVILENSLKHEYRLSDIKFYKMTKTNGRIMFMDNKKVANLEKLSYWPVFREYLLSKLEDKNE